jgi:hypothetical protein
VLQNKSNTSGSRPGPSPLGFDGRARIAPFLLTMEARQDKHTYVKVGDVVTLFCDQANGWMTSGDLVVGYGLWVPKLKGKMAVPPRVRETRIQIVPKLYYSSRKAYLKERTV